MMAKNCKSLHSIKIHDIIPIRLGKALASLVSVQDGLKSMDLNYSNIYDISIYEPIFQSLFDDQYNQVRLPPHLQNLFSSQKSIKKKFSSTSPSLSRLKITKTNLFNIQKFTLDSMIKKCNKLQSFELNHCTSINSLIPLQHSLTKLNDLKIFCHERDLNFVTEFFQTSNLNLKNIYLSWKINSSSLNTTSTIPSHHLEESFKRIQLLTNYCTQVKNLFLEILFPQELLLIFKSLIHLKKLSVTFNELINWDEYMEELGETLPKELQWLEVRNGKGLPFSIKGLQIFLEKGKEVNEDLELNFQKTQEAYLDVIKKYDFKINNYADDFNW